MSKSNTKNKNIAFDAQLFGRLLGYTKRYYLVFLFSLFTVIGLAVFGALRPKVLQMAMDQNIEQQIQAGFLKYILWMLILLFLEVVCNLFFIYYASWLGQSVVRFDRGSKQYYLLNNLPSCRLKKWTAQNLKKLLH